MYVHMCVYVCTGAIVCGPVCVCVSHEMKYALRVMLSAQCSVLSVFARLEECVHAHIDELRAG